MSDITVSIFILTYNQEQFIEQTIEGVLMQKTNFNYQLIIGEDYSTDDTRTICEHYAAEYGKKIKLLPSLHKNIGLIANYMRTIAACDGKYIAICDGDDYWIDEYKLQKQVDFLETNPDYSIVYTGVRKLFRDGNTFDSVYHLEKKNPDFDDLIFNNFIHSVTALFKNIQNSGEVPSWFVKFPFGDWQTYLWVIKDGGKIHFLEDISSVYRMNIGVSAGYMRRNSSFIQVLLKILENIYSDESFSHRKEIVAMSIAAKKNDLMTSFNREKSYFKAFMQYVSIMKNNKDRHQLTKLYLYSIYKSFK
ncbi:MAG: glycosyltransferase [bacterium]|nr:glycosyltransferase [bacterium]